ncbi:hypothetical protein AB3S75_026202 [Citrus x aurantiifolia]
MTTKQILMADDHSSQSSHSQNYQRPPVPSFFGSPRFKAFTKAIGETHEVAAAAAATISPTSILDSSKQFSPFCSSPFWDHDTMLNPPKSPRLFLENKHQGIGLALIDLLTDNYHKTINEDDNSSSSKPNDNNKVLFATKLRVQIPSLLPAAPSLHLSPSGSANSGTEITKDPPAKVINYTQCLSPTEMELSEEYTCVIAHGPNPKTTRIFDNCIIESYCSVSDSGINRSHSAPENFLSFCYTCKKNLEQTNDIYIYRGEKAFCSQECRYQEMLRDDEVEN